MYIRIFLGLTLILSKWIHFAIAKILLNLITLFQQDFCNTNCNVFAVRKISKFCYMSVSIAYWADMVKREICITSHIDQLRFQYQPKGQRSIFGLIFKSVMQKSCTWYELYNNCEFNMHAVGTSLYHRPCNRNIHYRVYKY